MRTVMTCYRRPDGRRRKRRQTLGREWVTIEVLTSRGIVTMAGKRWSGYFVWSWLLKRGPVRYWPEGWSYEEVKTMKKKKVPTAEGASVAEASRQTKVLAGFPHLLEHCSVRVYDDGSSRQTGRVFLDCVGSMWRAMAKDSDTGTQLVVFMPSVDDALLQLELLLGADEAPWEPDPFARAPKAVRGKK